MLTSMKLLAFAFQDNISSSILQKLDIVNKFYLPSNNRKIENFVEELVKINPHYILGLGMYSGKDKDKLRIETLCLDENETRQINYFLTPHIQTKLAKGIGNSYCNFVSFQIMKEIENKKLNTKYTFIHIPRTFDIDEAIAEINQMLSELK